MDLNWTSAIWDDLEAAKFRSDPDGEGEGDSFLGKQNVPPEIVGALNELKAKTQEVADTQ